jgi:cytochrome c oxidase subunit IV
MVVPLVFAFSSSGLDAFSAVMVVGLLVGVFGHIIKSRLLIITGIVLIGFVSVYFAVFVAKVR